MPLAADMMRAGFPGQAAQNWNGQINSTISAAGSTIADATRLSVSINVITIASSGQGVQLPVAQVGDEVDVCNLASVAVMVYPDASANRVNALTAGLGFTLAPNTSCKVKKFTTTRWIANLSA